MPTTNGREQVFNEGIKNNDDRLADTTADFLVTINADGTQGKIATSVIIPTVADATTTTKGIVKLAGDLAGTADLPTVPGLAIKQNISGVVSKTTISAIRALSGTLAYSNFYTTDTGKEGNWYYDSSDSTTSDNTGTVLVTSDGKRIKRIFDDFVNIEWFGALGDNSTDNTTFIQNALNTLEKVFVPKGNFISSNLTLQNKQTLYGVGDFSVLKFKTGSTGYFLNGDTKDGILITSLFIDGGNIINYSSTSSIGTRSGVYFSASNQNIKIDKCKITGFNGIAIGYNGTTVSSNESVSILNSNISGNYCAISTAPSGATHDTAVTGGAGGEYSKILGCTINQNRYGVVNSAGNTNVTGNNISNNGYGTYSAAVTNGGHGNITSNLINHSVVNSVYMQGNIQSAVISGNALYYGDINFDANNGILFTNNQLAVNNVTILGGYYHNFSNNFYYITPVFTGDFTNTIFSNNYTLGGTSIGTGSFVNNNSLVIDSGLTYDNSYNSVNNVVINGDFATDTVWTKGTGWTISGGKANSTVTSDLSQAATFVNGSYYVVEFDISNFVSGFIRVGIGGGASVSGYMSGNGHKKVLVQKPSSGGDSNFYLKSTSFVGSIDNVVVYESLGKKLTATNGIIISSEAANTIASFDASKSIKSLPLATYPSLTELAYVKGVTSAIQTQINSKSPLASPALTGTPTGPTATAGTNTTQLATTAFVKEAIDTDVTIQKIVDNPVNYANVDGGTSSIAVLVGSENDRAFEIIISDGVSNTASINLDNNASGFVHTAGDETCEVRASVGNLAITQTNASGSTIIGVEPPLLNTTINTPSISISGTYVYAVQPKEYLVSALPTPTGSDSRFAIVTDATAPTYLGALTGGGSIVCPVFYNGSDWVSH